jgi:hypothetical protein
LLWIKSLELREKMSHIFISYQQDDADFAAVLMMELEKAGFDTWLDKQRLRAGSDWSEEIDQGILTATALELVLSPASRASEYVTYEWSCAIGAGISATGDRDPPETATVTILGFSWKRPSMEQPFWGTAVHKAGEPNLLETTA